MVRDVGFIDWEKGNLCFIFQKVSGNFDFFVIFLSFIKLKIFEIKKLKLFWWILYALFLFHFSLCSRLKFSYYFSYETCMHDSMFHFSLCFRLKFPSPRLDVCSSTIFISFSPRNGHVAYEVSPTVLSILIAIHLVYFLAKITRIYNSNG